MPALRGHLAALALRARGTFRASLAVPDSAFHQAYMAQLYAVDRGF